MRIYLTGFMGSGKTALGELLAQELSRNFVDLDGWIERAAGKSVDRIFKEDGEAAFRKLERSLLKETVHLDNHVIALGGGALLHGWTMKWARARGTVVFLDVGVDEIVRRLLIVGRDRPLLANALNSDDPDSALRAVVTGMMKRRRTAYERAEVTFQPSGDSLRQDAKNLARLLRSQRTGPSDRASPD